MSTLPADVAFHLPQIAIIELAPYIQVLRRLKRVSTQPDPFNKNNATEKTGGEVSSRPPPLSYIQGVETGGLTARCL
jgi:hypothetical protein